ncbi:MAG: pyridoxal phosphate-dependent aminotransferase [Clostridia bacterium]|nr:pyridoxal phosphate-dependent aminotransferase [Clostridia bacterium]
MKLAKRVRVIEPSKTLELMAKAKALKAEGKNVLEFQVGEPDFNTPENVKEAAIKAIRDNFTHYTPSPGVMELRKAICEKLQRDNNLVYTPEEVMVSNGAKQCLFNAFLALVDEGDEVIVPAPYWVTYPEAVKIAGGTPVFLETTSESDFKVTPEQLEQAITDKTKALILCSPSNPTGSVYTEEELRGIAEVVKKHQIFVFADEIYEKLVYDGLKFVSFASLDEEVKKLTITFNGVSKAYAMTGWRIGYVAAEKEIIKAMNSLQSHATSNPNSIAQMATIEALTGPQDELEEMRREFDERRKYIVKALNEIPGITCREPKGAFYVFPDISSFIGKTFKGQKIENDDTFAKLLLDNYYVVAVPGSSFGAPGFLRFSYATSLENIKNGMELLKEFTSKIE